MTGPNFSAIRVRLRYESLEEFIQGYTRFISKGGMFIPMSPAKLKPVGTTIRFQFMLQDGTTALLGEGVVRQIQGADSGDSAPVGILVKFKRLNRESKELVEEILVRKQLEADAPEPAQAEPPPAQDPDATPIPDAFNVAAPDSQESAVEAPATLQPAHAETPADAEQGSDIGDEEPECDDLFLSDDDDSMSTPFEDSDAAESSAHDSADASDFPGFDFDDLGDAPSSEPQDTSGDDIFGDAQSEPEFAEISEPAPVEDETGVEPQRLGSTEAGLQILAFDRVSDEDAAGLASFDFGGEEDDVDQMFDDVFGDGGFFGGDDAAADPFALGAPAMDAELIGATANDGGEPLNATEEPHEDATAGEPGEPGDLFVGDDGSGEALLLEDEIPVAEGNFEDDLLLEEQLLGDEDVFSDEDLVADDYLADDDLFSEEVEAEEEVDAAPENDIFADDGIDASDDLFADDQPLSADDVFGEEAGEEDEPFEDAALLQDDLEFEDADVLADEDSFELADAADEGVEFDDSALLLEDEEVIEAPDMLLEEESDLVEDSGLLSTGTPPDFNPNPSDDVLSVLGSLNSDEVSEPSRGLTLGSAAGLAAVGEPEEEEEDDSLASLLALADQDIAAKREAEGQPAENDPNEDLFDQLLGGDDLPPPPDMHPVFDITEAEPKKKGFISKFFGKD